ncbi:MAG: hypothetical protein IJ619_12975 [Eubacterium sp.]|nr:hypothetical protein [Eubacterium sp.]
MNKMIAIAGTNYDPKKTSLTALRMTTYISAELLSAVMKEHLLLLFNCQTSERKLKEEN